MIAADGQLTLRCRTILPMSSAPISGGWIRIKRGKIFSIGRHNAPPSAIDLGDAIVLPGLINAHTHLEFSDLETPIDPSGGLVSWIEKLVNHRRQRSERDTHQTKVSSAIQKGLCESASVGVTTIGEISTGSPPEVYDARGPRVRVYHEGLGISSRTIHDTVNRLQKQLPSHRHTQGLHGLSPHAPYSVGSSLGRFMTALAQRQHLPVAMHIAESLDEVSLINNRSGTFRTLLETLGAWPKETPPTLLPPSEWVSLLAKTPRAMIVHGTFLPRDPDAMARLTRHRSRLAITICPRTTLALSGEYPPLASFLQAGLHVALGTDSRASNPDLSILSECRTLVDSGLASPLQTVLMATRNGAWALMLERQCGSLTCGRRADLTIVQPGSKYTDPFEALLDPSTSVIGTMRSGKWIHGSIDP